jgi:hypothetical protein
LTVPQPLPVIETPPQTTSVMPVDYYRRHAARLRLLVREATTPAIKKHLRGIADQYDRLADRVQIPTSLERETI